MPPIDPKTEPYARAVARPFEKRDTVPLSIQMRGTQEGQIAQLDREIAREGKRIELSNIDMSEQSRQNARDQRDRQNTEADWYQRQPNHNMNPYYTGPDTAPRPHDPNVAEGQAPSLQQAMQIAADYGHKNTGFTHPSFLNGTATTKLAQLSKDGVDVTKTNPQLLHMYITGDPLSQAYAFMRLSGAMDESGAMRRLPSVHTQGQK